MRDPKYKPESLPTSEEVAVATLRSLERLNEKAEETGMWIFGYGSLCWNPGFSFDKSLTGFVRGYSRKFWQGNATHRGTQKRSSRCGERKSLITEKLQTSKVLEAQQQQSCDNVRKKIETLKTLSKDYFPTSTELKPGRVATLVEEKEGVVWGQAFQVKEKTAFSYLNNRECTLGGYITITTTFYPRQDGNKRIKPFPAILYLATPSNSLWLGDSPLAEIANQIIESTGNSGHNVEYLLKLATFVRENIPEAVDDHLFTLECLVRSQIEERNLCLTTLMGEKKIENDEGEKAIIVRAKSGFQNVREEPNRPVLTYLDEILKRTFLREYLSEVNLFYIFMLILTVLENLPSIKTRYLFPLFETFLDF